QFGDAIADAAGHRHPAGAVPAADQLFAPFGLDHVRDPRPHRGRQRAQRVAVEIDHAIGKFEQRPRPGTIRHELICSLPKFMLAYAEPHGRCGGFPTGAFILLVAFWAGFAMLALPARALADDEVTSAQGVIRAQEQAFGRDDAASAYSFAAPALHEI